MRVSMARVMTKTPTGGHIGVFFFWLTSFDSGGVPLSGNDGFSVQDYMVVDSRDTRNEMAVSLGFGGAEITREHSALKKEQRIRNEGRRGREYI